jgi:prolyl-tRNA synthetase
MAHADDDGLILPPALAPLQVVVVPIYKSDEDLEKISEKIRPLLQKFKSAGITVKFDDDDTKRPGFKFAEYELKGVPVRLAMGSRDLEQGTIEVSRRDTKEKRSVPFEGIDEYVKNLLNDIQQNIFQKAKQFSEQRSYYVNSWDEFKNIIENKSGFVWAHWDGTTETEMKIKELTKATIRCIPLNNIQETGKCIFTGKPSVQRVVFARAY